MTCSNEYVEKLAQLKLEEASFSENQKRLHRLKNIVSFEKVLEEDTIQKCKKADIRLFSLDEVMAAGLDLINS